MMKLKILSSLSFLLISPFLLAEAQLTRVGPPQFEAVYSLHLAGTRVAEVARRVSHLADTRYEYTTETRTVGLVSLFRKDHIVEKSLWKYVDNQPTPTLYTYKRTGGSKDKEVSVAFDWEQQRITNTINGDAWQMPSEPAVMDKLLYQIAIMLDLESGNTSVSYVIADGGKIKDYSFEKIGEERIKTPLGEFDTIKMIRYRKDRNRTVTLWCAEELRYLPVKVENIEKDDKKSIAMIKSLSGISY